MVRPSHSYAIDGRERIGIALLIVVGLLAMACAGAKSGSDAYGEANAIAVQGSSIQVHMKDIQFQPKGIKVKPGTKVTWVNDDAVIHNVRQIEDVFLSPDVMKEGDTFSFTFNTAGRYRYQCTYHHPNMNGVVIVEPK